MSERTIRYAMTGMLMAGVFLISYGIQVHITPMWAAGTAFAVIPLLHLYHQVTGARSLLWLWLPARCAACGAHEGLRRWRRGWHCEDVFSCRDRTLARLAALRGKPS